MGTHPIDLLTAAWEKIEPLLSSDPTELARRLARRHQKSIRRAPRPWCLALRAADRRINPFGHEMHPSRPEGWGDDGQKYRRDHDVVFSASDLKRLCLPLAMPWPGCSVRKVAELLGCSRQIIQRAVQRNLFSKRKVPGRRMQPEWFIHTDKLLDPANFDGAHAHDPAWGTLWRYPAEHIPPGTTATLARTPWFRDNRFWGWNWVCPGCKKNVRILYCPMPGPAWASFVNRADVQSPDAPPQPLSTFACRDCHGVYDLGRLNAESWNDLIRHLSAGLLFGSEVPKPDWWKSQRKRPFQPRPTRKPGLRRSEIEALLLNTDLTCKQIALQINMPYKNLLGWIGYIYRKHSVHSRAEFRERLLGATVTTPTSIAPATP